MAASSNSAKWYVSSEGQRYGPYPANVLSEWIAVGRVADDAAVSDGGPWITPKQFMEAQAAAMHAAPAGAPVEVEEYPEEPVPATENPAENPPPQQANAAAELPPDDSVPERNRIVVVGRTQSGKTIYLAQLYQKLWRSLNGMTAKAVSGAVHEYLDEIHHDLQQGEWPRSTRGYDRQIELEIWHAQRRRLMVTLDFSGEIFRHAFVHEDATFAGVKELLDHIDRAAAVILLVDPSVISGGDRKAAADDDFGMVQVVQRIRNWPGGDSVPIVLVLTKMDQYQHLIDRAGGSKDFVRQNFPALVRLMKHVPIFQVSAVQIEKLSDGSALARPRKDSQPVNVDTPLRFCLDLIDKTQETANQQRLEERRIANERQLAEAEKKREKRQNWLLFIGVAAILAIGITVAILIIFRHP